MFAKVKAHNTIVTILLVIGTTGWLQTPRSTAQENAIIAIDILIEPDTVMVREANGVNAELRKNYPKGYALDASHSPHITLVQRFVLARDLDAVEAAVTGALKSGPSFPLKLKTTNFVSVEWAGVAVVVYAVERTPELMQLENKIVDAVQPFAVKGGTADAFAKTDD